MSAWSGGGPFVDRLGDDVGMIIGGEVTATGNVPDLRPKVDGQTLAEAELLERVGRTQATRAGGTATSPSTCPL